MLETRETTITLNLRERATEEAVAEAVRKFVRPWVDGLATEGLTCAPPIFNLRSDDTDPWTTHLDVSVVVVPPDGPLDIPAAGDRDSDGGGPQ